MMKRQMGSAIAAFALAASLGACSYVGSDLGSFAGKVDHENIGVATRAQSALIEGNHAEAVSLAERAVENSPNDAGFRALLGNAYFASGRFASAEAAYRDTLAIMPAQPQVILKKALVEIAQGKQAQALSGLERARGYVDAADLGLAVALAGRPHVAVDILENAARTPGATARTRQNLALAHALTGEWTLARTVAAQDIPAEQLDARLQSWMGMTTATHPSQQVASLVGVMPAQVDPGQPVRLALQKDEAQPQYAALAPQGAPAPAVAQAEPAAPSYRAIDRGMNREKIALAAAPVAHTKTIDIPVRDIELVETTAEVAQAEEQAVKPSIDVDPVAPVALVAQAAKAAKTGAPKAGLSNDTKRLTESVDSIRTKAVAAEKASRSVVQVASYSARKNLEHGWDVATKRFKALDAYQPMAARFEHEGKTYYRLAAHGFASDAAAREFCGNVKRAGGDCFVRKMAGDAPTRFAQKKTDRKKA